MRQGFAIALIIGILFALWLLNTGRWNIFWSSFKTAFAGAKASPGSITPSTTLPQGKTSVPGVQQPGVSVPPGGVAPYNPTNVQPGTGGLLNKQGYGNAPFTTYLAQGAATGDYAAAAGNLIKYPGAAIDSITSIFGFKLFG
jgi:hypothetical protein